MSPAELAEIAAEAMRRAPGCPVFRAVVEAPEDNEVDQQKEAA